MIDNSIDAGASKVCIVFHTDDFRLTRIAIHDDGEGMDSSTMRRALRLGVHEPSATVTSTIGIYGVGMKDGSFANADRVTVVSQVKGQFPSGLQMTKGSFDVGVLRERSNTEIWNLRNKIIRLDRGTTIIWDNLTSTVYQGENPEEAREFLGEAVEKVRRHVGIRYHRFLESDRLAIRLLQDEKSSDLNLTPNVEPIDPFAYRKTGDPNYPKKLVVDGQAGASGFQAHIWPNRSQTDQFLLEEDDDMGHQGFYVYSADRLITQGGWNGFRTPKKDWKLLRIAIDDARVVDKYITVSPQKNSVRFTENFHRFVESLRADDGSEVTFNSVCEQATETLRLSNKQSGKATPLAECGQGLPPAVRRVIEDYAPLNLEDPINVLWKDLDGDKFVRVESSETTVYINRRYQKILNSGRGRMDDAPLVKTLLYLLFNKIATSKKTKTNRANTELWSTILAAAAEEQHRQDERRFNADE